MNALGICKGIVLLAVLSVVWPVRAQTVALFYDGRYVATNTTASSEAYNMKQALLSMDFKVKTFSGITSTDFSNVLAGADALIIPELKNGELETNLTSEVVSILCDFVESGNMLIQIGDFYSRGDRFINSTFGFAIKGSSTVSGSLVSSYPKGTIFEGGPSALAGVNGLFPWISSSLPSGTRSVYGFTREVDYTTVALIPKGSGRIVLLAWDWYNAAPCGTQDSGWNAVLQRVIKSSSGPMPGVILVRLD